MQETNAERCYIQHKYGKAGTQVSAFLLKKFKVNSIDIPNKKYKINSYKTFDDFINLRS